MNNDNIVAIATASGYAGVGIVRISGTNNISHLITKLTGKTDLKPRIATYCNFYNSDNEIIDSGLIIYFPAPNSFTGEDVLELHGHGSPVVLNMLVQTALNLGCRLAEPGEFSRRAYLNSKIDLVQAESIIDLIHAESEMTAKSALRSLKGQFSQHIDTINQQLIDLRMFVEATLDFPEEDIEFIANAKIRSKLETLQQDIGKLLKNTRQGVILNNGINVVIIGRPNVGKSSLLNALANEDIAIVTDIAGTTRDIVKEKIIVNGLVLNIIDTAGIRATNDIVEQIGINRAINALKEAGLCLVLIDDTIGITSDDEELLQHIPALIPRLFVHNKIDLTKQPDRVEERTDSTHIYISAKQNIGIDKLRDTILASVGFDTTNTDVFIARTRHLNALKLVIEHIDFAFKHWENLELVAEELRYGHTKLSEITGEFTSDDLLGEIFSRFCIGK
jgi:tRNA modification GTPase